MNRTTHSINASTNPINASTHLINGVPCLINAFIFLWNAKAFLMKGTTHSIDVTPSMKPLALGINEWPAIGLKANPQARASLGLSPLELGFQAQPPRMGATHRADCAPRAPRDSAHGCRSSWSSHLCGPATPALCECRNRPQVDEWQNYGETYGN